MIRFELKLPSLPPMPPMPNLGRYILITFLVVSLIMSGTSMYVSLAAPQRAIFVPSTVGFEGQLADSQGVPVADGQYTITFTLYDAATGGTNVWSETQQSVGVKDGLYSVQLGSVTTLEPDDFNANRYLGIKVGSDAEMSPRIQVGAVPFALNAQHAMGLQGNEVSADAPQNKDALLWNSAGDGEWEPRGLTFPDLAPVGSNASPNDLLQNYRSGAVLRWKNATTVEVAAGELMINGYMRRNTSAVDVKFAADAGGHGPNRGLDTGTAGPGLTYYIYAVADDGESTFDCIISASGAAPTGVTNYRKIGLFGTEAANTDVKKGSVANSIPGDHFVPTARVYNNANQSAPAYAVTALVFNSERWDTDDIHESTTNTTRLTAHTPGKYLIFGNVEWNAGNNYQERQVFIRLNGNVIIAFESGYINNGAVGHGQEVSTIYDLAAGDYIELVVQPFIASSIVVNGTHQYSPEFGMVWLGP